MFRAGLAVLAVLAATACSGDPRGFAITPRVLPTVSPTEEPPPTRTPRSEPTATRTALPSLLWVANAGRDGVVLRDAPGTGGRVVGLGDGVRLVPLGEEETQGGRRWLRVRDPEGRVGWISAEFVSPTAPGTPGARTPTTIARTPTATARPTAARS
jgi:hypothetical protein